MDTCREMETDVIMRAAFRGSTRKRHVHMRGIGEKGLLFLCRVSLLAKSYRELRTGLVRFAIQWNLHIRVRDIRVD